MLLRVKESEWVPFVEHLRARNDVETGGVILAERLSGNEVLLARHLIPVPADAYQIRRIDQLRIDPVAINRIVRRARDAGLSVITIHTHPRTQEPWFSLADDNGDARLMPSLFAQMPGPHGSMVMASETGNTIGRLWLASGATTALEVRVVGRTLGIADVDPTGDDEPAWFARQHLALGAHGHARLRRLHVAVVGLGGTGSVAFVQLAHLGVGRITIIDGDKVERSNVSRIVGATRHDAGLTAKVDVAARYAAGLDTQVEILRGHLGVDLSTTLLENCDVILSCVDRHTPRAVLNRLAYEKAIPVIDMGSVFRVDTSGAIEASAGRVVVIGPGRRCLACWGHIDPVRLRIEALSPEDRAGGAAEGYIEGADVPQPSVVAFNTMIAGAAIIELLRLVTQFAGASDSPARLSFDFETGTVRRNTLGDTNPCSICAQSTAHDDLLPIAS